MNAMMTGTTKKTTKAPVIWTAYVRSSVYAGPVNEDGETPDQLAFYVVCENERGDRFASAASFTTEDYREIFYVGNVRVHSAQRRAERLLEAVKKGLAAGADPRRSERWSRVAPCYGSEAYTAYGEAEEVMWEKKDAEMETGERILP